MSLPPSILSTQSLLSTRFSSSFRWLIPALLFATLPAFASQAHTKSDSQVSALVFHKTMGGDGDSPSGGDGPCYDAAKKTLDACLKAATAAGSSAAGQMCHDTYAVQLAACDASYGE